MSEGKDPNGRFAPRNRKEALYEKLRGKVSVRALDIIIALLALAFVAVVAAGMLKGGK